MVGQMLLNRFLKQAQFVNKLIPSRLISSKLDVPTGIFISPIAVLLSANFFRFFLVFQSYLYPF